MKEIINEYGSAILAAISSALLLSLFSVLVFSPDGVVPQNIRTFAGGYAGEKACDLTAVTQQVGAARKKMPELKAQKNLYAKKRYDTKELFAPLNGYELRAVRATLLDDTKEIETENGRGNMAEIAYENAGVDVSGQVLENDGKTLLFPSEGYYALKMAAADGNGNRTSGIYLISVRRAN